MIEKLDHYPVPDIHTVVEKLNEIIDFLNDTNAMKVRDGDPISVTGGYVEWPAINNITTFIDEIHPLETLVNVDKYPDSFYDSFRKEVCAGCNDPNCLRSQVEIYDCDKFDSWLFEV